MNSLLYVSTESGHGPGICCRTVSIGGPSITDEPNDVVTFYGENIDVKYNNGKNVLSVHGKGEVNVYKRNGEVVAFGEYTNVNNGPGTLSTYKGETCLNPDTGEAVVIGGASLTVNGKWGTGYAFNVDCHTIPGDRTSLIGDHIKIGHHSYSMDITVKGGKGRGDKANLEVNENKDTVLLGGGIIDLKHGEVIVSAINGNAYIKVEDYTSINGDSIVLRYGNYAEIFVSNAKMYVVNNANSEIYLYGNDANFRVGKENRFVQDLKEVRINCTSGTIYCNGEVVCSTPLLKEIGKLLFTDLKPASALTS